MMGSGPRVHSARRFSDSLIGPDCSRRISARAAPRSTRSRPVARVIEARDRKASCGHLRTIAVRGAVPANHRNMPLKVRTVGNAFVNNQHRESPFCLRRFWASTPAATTSLRAHSYAHSALVGRLNRMCCDDSVGWLTETLSGVAFRAQPTRNGRTLARASLDIAGRSECDLSMSITVTAPPRATAGRRAARTAVRRGRASARSATSRSRRSPGRRRARERTT